MPAPDVTFRGGADPVVRVWGWHFGRQKPSETMWIEVFSCLDVGSRTTLKTMAYVELL